MVRRGTEMKWMSNANTRKGLQLMGSSTRAFTLIELLVTIGIIGVLMSLLLPVLSSAKEKGRRAQCVSNLHQLGIGMLLYAQDNNEKFIEAKRNHPWDTNEGSFVQNCLQEEAVKGAESVNLNVRSNSSSVWTCPNRPGLPLFEGVVANQTFSQWVIGYQYFGGITNWVNPSFPDTGIASRSPVTLSQAKPNWCLAADAVMKVDGRWGGNEVGRPP